MKNVTIAALIVSFVWLCSAERPRIVVAPFTCAGTYCRDAAASMSDKLNTALATMDRFEVIERSRLVHVFNEQSFGMSGAVDEETAARAGKIIGAQIVVMGCINQLSSERSKEGIYSFTLSAGIKFVDAETGTIKRAVEISERGSDDNRNSAYFNCISRCAAATVQEIRFLYPIDAGVARIDGRVIFLSRGSNDGVKPGMRFRTVRVGESIFDPKTGQLLGTEKIETGLIEVTETDEQYSRARIIRQKSKIEVGDALEEVRSTPHTGVTIGYGLCRIRSAVNSHPGAIYPLVNRNGTRDTIHPDFSNLSGDEHLQSVVFGFEFGDLTTGLTTTLQMELLTGNTVSGLFGNLDFFWNIPVIHGHLWIPIGAGIALGGTWIDYPYAREYQSMVQSTTIPNAENSTSAFQFCFTGLGGLRTGTEKLSIYCLAGWRFAPTHDNWKISYTSTERNSDGNKIEKDLSLDSEYRPFSVFRINGFYLRAGLALGF